MPEQAAESVEEYIASFPPEVRRRLEELRALVRGALPGAEESIGYGMPTYSYDGRHLTFFAGWKSHLALYAVHSFAGDDARLEADIAPYRSGKDTVKLPVKDELPGELITRVVAALRAKRNAPRA
ncbi:DUF1801 domain-containing protein [Herbiconiux sp. CPCC 203407]|uniref:DUF1801 domain-containing protein n=1 Tax=Herbiconiux oxytropis TaxID=2970915 RepID=A0AA42BVJ4_9MICO|nr:DUF1801 domain-containing protein [Herbiconiux oxytropis]MCS5721800.1 DUF1801 domain-containing protein [Herbiconiux oxytropis]MCS5727326.1 DUF1801 domain-containing protein [Herbiconiux oxytropis]